MMIKSKKERVKEDYEEKQEITNTFKYNAHYNKLL